MNLVITRLMMNNRIKLGIGSLGKASINEQSQFSLMTTDMNGVESPTNTMLQNDMQIEMTTMIFDSL